MTGQAISHIEKLRDLDGLPRSVAAEQLGLCEAYVVELQHDQFPIRADTARMRAGRRCPPFGIRIDGRRLQFSFARRARNSLPSWRE